MYFDGWRNSRDERDKPVSRGAALVVVGWYPTESPLCSAHREIETHLGKRKGNQLGRSDLLSLPIILLFSQRLSDGF